MNTQSYLVPISVKGIIIEGDEVWLRQNERGEWELPGGKLDRNEQPEEALVREVKEELGFDIEVTKIIQSFLYEIGSSIDESHGVLVISYYCNLLEKSGEFEIIGEAGRSEFRKFPLAEIKALKMPDFYKKAILKATEN